MDPSVTKSTSDRKSIVGHSPQQGFMPGDSVYGPYSFPDFVVGVRISRIALATVLPLF
jgi:hypothetical protein